MSLDNEKLCFAKQKQRHAAEFLLKVVNNLTKENVSQVETAVHSKTNIKYSVREENFQFSVEALEITAI